MVQSPNSLGDPLMELIQFVRTLVVLGVLDQIQVQIQVQLQYFNWYIQKELVIIKFFFVTFG